MAGVVVRVRVGVSGCMTRGTAPLRVAAKRRDFLNPEPCGLLADEFAQVLVLGDFIEAFADVRRVDLHATHVHLRRLE